jgi:hypothetical protein
MEASRPTPLGTHVQSPLELSHFVRRVVGPRGHALALTPIRRRDQSRALSLRRGSDPRHRRYSEPLGLPPRTAPLHHLRLIGAAFARRGPRIGSLQFPSRPSLRAVFRTPEVSCAPPVPGTVCCLRPEMTGSATSPFRVPISRGCKVHALAFGPQLCSPRAGPHGPGRAFDAPLRHGDLSPVPGACYAALRRLPRRDSTRWSGTASSLPRTETAWFKTRHWQAPPMRPLRLSLQPG